MTFTLYHGGGTNQQEVQQEGCSQEGDVCKRSGHDSRQKQEPQEVLEQWKRMFKKHGPIMRREKTEEMWV